MEMTIGQYEQTEFYWSGLKQADDAKLVWILVNRMEWYVGSKAALRLHKTANINGKILPSLKPLVRTRKKLQKSWTYKTAKIFSRTRRVRP
jgi:hypothetical protein